MKIGIHYNKDILTERWITYCKDKGIPYKVVNCYDNNIINELADCDALMWPHYHANYKDKLFAKQLLFSLEHSGKAVYPNFFTGWHFDDKVGQKYLFEALKVPFAPSYIFYSKEKAINWINTTTFPKVFKLRGGAGSSHVKLIRTRRQAIRIVNKAFGKGFSQFDRIGHLKERIRKAIEGLDPLIGIFKGLARSIISTEYAMMHGNEKGYVYFQEFFPNNSFDIRVIVIGDKAFAIKRMTRKNDFRASGSGNFLFDKSEIDERCVQIAFKVNKKLKTQSIAYDFIFDKNKKPFIVEISYGFTIQPFDHCPGYWDSKLNWFEEKFNPQNWIIENLISTLQK